MGINEGIGRENLIDQIVQITGKEGDFLTNPQSLNSGIGGKA